MAERRQVFIDYVQRFLADEGGLNNFKKRAEELKRNAHATASELDTVAKALKKASKEKLEVAYDREGVEKALEDINHLEGEYERLQKRFSRGVPIPPTIRASAREQLAIIQERRAHLEQLHHEIVQTEQQQVALVQASTAKESAIREAAAAKDKSTQFKLAHARARIEDQLQRVIAQREAIGGPKDVAPEFARAKTEIDATGRAFNTVSARTRSAGQHVEAFTARLRQVFPVLRGLGVVVGAGLTPALLGLVAGLSAAAAGFGGLAIAALGAASIIGTVLIGAFSRLGAVMDVVKQRQAAQQSAALQAAAGSKQNAAANEQLREAQSRVERTGRAVGRGQRTVTGAQEKGAEASKKASAALETQAERAERLSDALLDLKSAQLDAQEAPLNTREAILDLKRLREEAGLSADSFKKFTDVDATFDKAALRKALGATGADEEQKIAIEKAIIRVRRARLAEEQATDRVSDAQRELKKTGLEGAGASDTAADSGFRLANANDTSANAVSAHEEAQRDLAEAQANVADVTGGVTAATQSADAEFKKLTRSEQKMVLFIEKYQEAFKKLRAQGTDPVIDSFRRIGERAVKLAPLLGPALAGVGRALGSGFEKSFKNLTTGLEGFKSFTSFGTIAKGAREIAAALAGPVLTNGLRILRDIARAFTPHLVKLVKDFGSGLGDIAKGTGTLGSKSGVVQTYVRGFRSFLRLVKAVAGAFLAFGEVAGDAGAEFMDFLSEGVKGWASWARSEDGRKKITAFFEDTMPFARQAVRFIVKFGKVFLQAFQAAAPALTVAFEGMNMVLDVLSFLLAQFNRLPAPVRAVIGLLLSVFGAMRGGLLSVQVGFGKFKTALGFALAGFGAFSLGVKHGIEAVKRYVSDLLGPIYQTFWTFIKKVLRLFGIQSPSTVFIKIGKGIIQGFVSGVKSGGEALLSGALWLVNYFVAQVKALGTRALELGKTIVRKVRDGMVAAAGAISTGARTAFNKVGETARSFWPSIYRIGRKVVGEIARGITAAKDAVFTALRTMFEDMVKLAERILGIKSPSKRFASIGKHMMEGLTKGIGENRKGPREMLDKMFSEMPENKTFKVSGHFFHKNEDYKRYRPGTEGSRKYGIQEVQGRGLAVGPKALWDVGREMLGKLPGLASGGIVNHRMFAELGEAGREAVIPLTGPVLDNLAESIVGAMSIPTPGGGRGRLPSGIAPASHSSTVIEKQEVNLPAPPGGGIMDPRYAAVQFAREIKRRGF